MIVLGTAVTHAHTRAVKLLLWSWFDLDYQPPTATGQITRQAGASRVAESETAPTYTTRCDACGGDGAHGNGQRCAHCAGSGKRVWPWLQDPDREPRDSRVDPVDAALDRKRASGSYALLEKHLAGLVKCVNKPVVFADLDGPRAQRLLVSTYVPDPDAYSDARLDPFTAAEARLDAGDRAQVELALAYLAFEILRDERAQRGEARIRVPGDVRKAELAREHWALAVKSTRGPGRAARDREIKRLARVDGWQVPALAARFGLSRSQVYEVLYGRQRAS